MDILTLKKAGKNAESLIRPIYEDKYGLTYSLDNTLYRNPTMDTVWSYNDNPVDFARTSVSYDSVGGEVSADSPVYEPFNLRGLSGLRVAPNTINLFNEPNSLSFDSPQTINLSAGNYTISIKAGTGKLVVTGAVAGEVESGGCFSFNLGSAEDVTFTPTDGIPELAQLEALPYKTPWQKGGVNRTVDSPRWFVPQDTLISEYGFGLLFRPYIDSSDYHNNEHWLVYGRKDAQTYFRLFYSTTFQRFSFQHVLNGDIKTTNTAPISFIPNELLGVYVHVIPSVGVFLYASQNDSVYIFENKDDSLSALGMGVNHISLGHRLRALNQRDFATNMLFSSARIEIAPRHTPNPQRYFREVLG